MATAAVALSLVLGGCGSSNTMEEPEPQPPPEPMPTMEEVEGFVQLRVDEARALNDTLRQLGLTGTTGNILDLFGISPIRFMIPAGGMTYQGGVWFECHSEYDCEVSVGRTLSGVQVSWTSQQKIEGGMADVVAKLPKRYGPFPEMNDFGPDSGSVVTRSPSFSVRYFLLPPPMIHLFQPARSVRSAGWALDWTARSLSTMSS